MKASTQGCTEWSCIYHGELNRLKSQHEEHCPIHCSLEHVTPEDVTLLCVCEEGEGQ